MSKRESAKRRVTSSITVAEEYDREGAKRLNRSAGQVHDEVATCLSIYQERSRYFLVVEQHGTHQVGFIPVFPEDAQAMITAGIPKVKMDGIPI